MLLILDPWRVMRERRGMHDRDKKKKK